MKTKKTAKTIGILAAIAAFVFLSIFLIVKIASTKHVMSTKDADKKIGKMVESINPSETDKIKASVDVSENTNLDEELPKISKYPVSVEGKGDIDIEIFAAPEKAGSGTDGWMIESANKFNAQNNKIGSKSVSVTIRSMSSGTGADYIISGKYVPDAYSPSSSLWGQLIQASGREINTVESKLTGNVAGILVSQKVKNELMNKYGKVDFKTVVEATASGNLAMGYTYPFTSSTGLNFLLETLYTYDKDNILSDKAIKGFSEFQKNVPFVSYTTQQMRDAAGSGSLDGMVTEYQTYINDKNLSNYEFVPFGYRHDGPMYSVGKLSNDKEAGFKMFTEFCKSDEMQKKASECGFNQYDNFKSEIPEFEGSLILEAQRLWKKNKDVGSSITAVFVADTSGSMSGAPIKELKESLINAGKYIGENNSIGLVSFNSEVYINLPIEKFNLTQHSYFNGAVGNLSAYGGTATYNGIAVATNMLIKAKKANPDTKLVLFLLSDGQSNCGYKLRQLSPVLESYKIPVYSIAYGEDADIDELKEVSGINEAAVIKADSDDVLYQLKNLFNAQM